MDKMSIAVDTVSSMIRLNLAQFCQDAISRNNGGPDSERILTETKRLQEAGWDIPNSFNLVYDEIHTQAMNFVIYMYIRNERI